MHLERENTSIMKKNLLLAALTMCCLLTLGLAACAGEPSTSSTTTPQSPSTTAGQTGSTPAADSPWTQLEPQGDKPAARAGQCMVYDSKNDAVILFGGTDSLTFFSDTWKYSPPDNTWTNQKPAGDVPEGRVASSMVYDPVSGKVILFGGVSKTESLGDTWAYDLATNTWTELQISGTAPSARGGHAMVYSAALGKVLLYGGKDAKSVLNDTWTFDFATTAWTQLQPATEPPIARYGHAMAVDEATGKIVVFAGWDTDKYFTSTWTFDPAANTWASLDTTGGPPPARAGHCLTYDPATGKMVLFGGTTGKSFLRDVIYFNVATSTWELSKTGSPWPEARNGHSMVHDAAAKATLLFGGWNGKTYYSDMWSLAD